MNYKISKSLFTSISFIAFSLPQIAHSQEYSLFNPVPKNEMRPMKTERPSKSDSSYTVDSGHIQIETSLYSYTKKKDVNSRNTDESAFNSTTFRLGINQSMEVQTIVTPIVWKKEITYKNSKTTHHRGFGDTTLRFKYNFIGNDSGDISIAAIPHVKIPTNGNNIGNNFIEGGLSLPVDAKLKDGYSLNYNIQYFVLKRTDGSKNESVFANAVSLEKELNEKTSGFIEYYIIQLADNTKFRKQSLGLGIIQAINKNFSIDSAINFGLSNTSDDIEILFGGSYRF